MENSHNTNTTSQFVSTFFVTLGIIFIVVLALLAYFVIADPLELRPLIFGESESRIEEPAPRESELSGTVVSREENATEFTLSASQRDALSGYGIDPASIPTVISPLQVLCFEEKLGVVRVGEIRNGAVPSTFEFFEMKTCLGS